MQGRGAMRWGQEKWKRSQNCRHKAIENRAVTERGRVESVKMPSEGAKRDKNLDYDRLFSSLYTPGQYDGRTPRWGI